MRDTGKTAKQSGDETTNYHSNRTKSYYEKIHTCVNQGPREMKSQDRFKAIFYTRFPLSISGLLPFALPLCQVNAIAGFVAGSKSSRRSVQQPA